MAIITITSDLGDSSHYVAVIKGVIYSLMPAVKLVDISHHISDFNVLEAAYLVRNTYPFYPKGTIHIVAVDPDYCDPPTGLVMKMAGQYFVGSNNGALSLIAEGQEHEVVTIENEGLIRKDSSRSFRAAGVFAPTAAFLASGGTMEEIGSESEMMDLRWGAPSYSDGHLRGNIIHIDKFGNAITNIRKEEFLELRNERSFEIFIRNIRLKRIVTTYSDVGKADALAIFGENNHLEIAMREASAASLLGLKVHDMITIEFK